MRQFMSQLDETLLSLHMRQLMSQLDETFLSLRMRQLYFFSFAPKK